MPRPRRVSGDPELVELFDQFEGRLVTPAGAAALLGLSHQTVYSLCEGGQLRAYRGHDSTRTRQWVYIPLEDVWRYGTRTGRSSATATKWSSWFD